jgi:diguanylate cyclase (GGDEF)-like protein
LTGLANRHEFTRKLSEILGNPDPERRGLIAFTVNLDRFRKVNNLHGTRLGDQILKITAERLLSGIRSRSTTEMGAKARSRDIVARLGADEFGIVCGPSEPSIADAEDIAHRLLRMIQNPIAIGELSLRLTASIGFVVTGPTHHDADDVMRDLDVALRHAKVLGPGKIAAWEPALTKKATGQASLAEQLQRAFDNGEFVLHYQPIVSLSDNHMVGAEALLRWNHPSEGLVAPAAFLPVIEETGLIVEVGCWVVREAVRQVEAWRMLYGRDIVDWVSINLSARQFTDPASLLATLREIYDGGWLVHRLKFEVTETTLMRNPEISRAVLAEFQKLGIRVAIDDFGTGYSSLNSLRHYPIETIKIDAEFIAQIGAGEGEKLAQALLDLAGIYGVAIIAEGVETIGQRDFLHERGCGFGQGYLFAEPMAAAPFGAYALTHAVRSAQSRVPFWLSGPSQSSDINRSVAGRLSQWGA